MAEVDEFRIAVRLVTGFEYVITSVQFYLNLGEKSTRKIRTKM